MWESKGKVAVVTGAASGIGAGIARACAEADMRLVLADIEPGPAERLAAELAADGAETLVHATDVARAADLESLADASFARFGAVDVLFNNAGVAQGGALHTFTSEDWAWLLGVNLYGVIHGCRSFVPRWIERGVRAHVVNTASIGGFLSGPTLGMYTTTKFAVVGYSEALAAELAPHGIGVTALCPGLVNTNLGAASRNRPAGLGAAPDGLGALTAMMADGLDPLAVGRHALRGVRENALHVFTDAAYEPVIAERFEKVLAALRRAKEPPSGADG